MKNVSSLVKNVQKLLDDNSPVILTGAAIAGTFATAYLTFKGSHAAANKLQNERYARLPEGDTLDDLHGIVIPKQETFLLTYKFYAPAAVAAVGTSACMFMATKIGLNRTAAIAGALVVAERGSDQYRDKVKELLGEKQDIKVVDAVANDRVAAIPSADLVMPREGEQTFVDNWSGRSFSSTTETIKKAVNDFNSTMLTCHYSSLNDFYNNLGLSDIQEGDALGWNKENLLKLNYTTTLKNDRAVVVFTFDKKPMPTFQDDYS